MTVDGALVLRLMISMCMSRVTGIDFLGSTELRMYMEYVIRRGKMLKWVAVALCTVVVDA
jgi:hypothetical protein